MIRAINARRLSKCIQENNLDIEVPQKYLYKVNGEWRVVAKALDIDQFSMHPNGEKISLKEVQDLTCLTKEVCLADVTTGNIVRNKQTGKVAFIDTEALSFQDNATKSECVSYLNDGLEMYMTREGKEWAKNHRYMLYSSKEGSNKVVSLEHFKNENGIDLERAKEEWNMTNKFANRLKKFDSHCVSMTDELHATQRCTRLIGELETLSDKLKKYNVRGEELLAPQRQAVLKYWKSVSQNSDAVDKKIA